jgi:hypothetical protein
MSYRLGESDEAMQLCASRDRMFMEGNQILESFAKRRVYLDLVLFSFLGKILISWFKTKKTLHCCKVFKKPLLTEAVG